MSLTICLIVRDETGAICACEPGNRAFYIENKDDHPELEDLVGTPAVFDIYTTESAAGGAILVGRYIPLAALKVCDLNNVFCKLERGDLDGTALFTDWLIVSPDGDREIKADFVSKSAIQKKNQGKQVYWVEHNINFFYADNYNFTMPCGTKMSRLLYRTSFLFNSQIAENAASRLIYEASVSFTTKLTFTPVPDIYDTRLNNLFSRLSVNLLVDNKKF